MATASDVVNGATDNLLYTTQGETLSAADMADSIVVLNDMMAMWAIDIETGYTKVSLSADPVTVPDALLLPIKQNLALEIAPILHKDMRPGLEKRARASWKSLLRRQVLIGASPYPDTLPFGTGNRDYSSISNEFYADNTPDQGILSLVSNATVTTIAAVDTPVLIAGTWVIGDTKNFTSTAAGRFTYDQPSQSVTVWASLSVTCASEVAIKSYVVKNGTVATSSTVVGKANTVPGATEIYFKVDLIENDYLELYIENTDDDTDLTVQSAQFRVSG